MPDTYGKAFRRKCYELADKVDLDLIDGSADQEWFYRTFTHYLDIIHNYYVIKMCEVKASRREKLHIVSGQAS